MTVGAIARPDLPDKLIPRGTRQETSMPKTEYLSPDGVARLETELEELIRVRRPEVAEKIAAARGFGDLSENAEYEEAKNDQAFLEGRIATIESLLANAEIIKTPRDNRQVRLGSSVTICFDDGAEDTYTIVGSAEANPAEGRISNESPIGAAALGHKLGDKVTATTPRGPMTFEITAIG
jgi:transcription elongation factor GreA